MFLCHKVRNLCFNFFWIQKSLKFGRDQVPLRHIPKDLDPLAKQHCFKYGRDKLAH